MFDEIRFNTIERLPNYVFAEVNAIKMNARRLGKDIIDFSMGNPDGKTPQHIIDKLCESANKDKTSGYSASIGIFKLRLAICDWYQRKYNVSLDPETEVVATMGSKEGFVNLARAIINPGDVAIVPTPAYPIHTQAFIIAGGNVVKMPLIYNENFELDEDKFFQILNTTLQESVPKPKYLVVNFPHNPTTVICEKSFYEKLVQIAKKERFYIISDIAYADLTYNSYKTPSILEIDGAKDVAVETYTLSKSYNMAGWRVGFVAGNKRLINALKKIKSWFDYGMYTPIQVAATVALNSDQSCVEKIRLNYEKRMQVLIESFSNIGWNLSKPKASMFVWAKLPPQKAYLKSLEFSKQLLQEANVAVSPGVGFGEAGDDYVRIALIENENRIRQASRNIKKYLKE
ncbi:LL-diaminopimelate aminotransferase [Campylobacter sp. RM10532]|uniref:LL-diaminopimelate aminotransferase n=1 Tax=Campylobacter molothri TaxID=1032242 RepID=A0ACC5W271_9BACT|nr:LL-diaminopimelate aminotransferase [Campylobacter sp. RM10537]MBZ7928515.1 LL-diaminopimelate aminotransferase [Campylobacter sp. RM10542]MBZ7931400.1 LL-diaminopimelate aminotransferase [Campylobacter sp. RM12910]MBZ7932938.1 LL-diaminopimelate aminotransferase [Campylobacter sp. RM10543]MBZ7937442.1 LL-diaminopimelate aminotransferase [Campylobacter sp. RM10538]MBZ7940902.1 LL-diaminopimelate aminotransferase [Campylobacter sp. W0047]MBZ7943734.1 LL-diaminopimelate aminotransferase [Cam